MRSINKYLITLIFGSAMALLIAYSKGVFDQTEAAMVFHILTDSLCVPAVLIMGLGGIIFVSNEGAFDALSYGLNSFFDMFRKEKKNQFRTFYDYKESKDNDDKPFGFLLICGLIFFVLMLVMYLLYTLNL